jgi:hypothetical protein
MNTLTHLVCNPQYYRDVRMWSTLHHSVN